MQAQKTEKTDRRTLKVPRGRRYGLNGQERGPSPRRAPRSRCAVMKRMRTAAERRADRACTWWLAMAATSMCLEKGHVEQARVVVMRHRRADITRRIGERSGAPARTSSCARATYGRSKRTCGAGASGDPEGVRTNIEIFYRVLRKYLVPSAASRSWSHLIRGNPRHARSAPVRSGTPPSVMKATGRTQWRCTGAGEPWRVPGARARRRSMRGGCPR